MNRQWKIQITETAASHIQRISDRRIQQFIIARIRGLEHDPELQGKRLVGDLAGYYSIRAVGQRYRVIYQLLTGQVVVVVVAAGIRKTSDRCDSYAIAKRLVKAGLLGRRTPP